MGGMVSQPAMNLKTSFSFRQCGINHMAYAAYAAGPALLGAPRSLSSILFRIFCFLFQRGAHANSVPVRGRQRAQVPQNVKSEAPKSGGPQTFFSPCFSFSARGPNSPPVRGPKEPKSNKNLKSEASKIGAPNVFPLFQRGTQTVRGPKEPKVPRKMSDLKI